MTFNICLLSPYDGGNLGDMVILDALIYNIKERLPSADLYGITMDPIATERIHKIKSFPISYNSLPYYSINLPTSITPKLELGFSARTTKNKYEKFKAIIKRLSYLFKFLKFIYLLSSKIYAEVKHVTESYSFLKNCNLVLVAGGGQIDDYWGGPWGHPYALLKWGLLSRIRKAKFVFLSVGKGSLESPLSSVFINLSFRVADYRSYRDKKTKNNLKSFSFTQKDLVYPDIAFSYPIGIMTKAKKQIENVVGVSLISYLSKVYWPKTDERIFNQYFINLVNFLYFLLQQGKILKFFGTATPDIKINNLIINELKKCDIPNLQSKILQLPLLNPNELFLEINDVEFVIGSRLHGILISHLLLKPVIAISYDVKINSHMENMDQSEYCLDISMISAQSLIDKYKSLNNNYDNLISIMKWKISEFTKNLNFQYDYILGHRKFIPNSNKV